MANSNNPFGFKPVRHLDGSPFNSQGQLCFVPSSDGTALYVGDVVKLLLPGGADPNGYGCPQVVAAGASDTPYGVVMGVDPVLDGGTPNLYISYRPASTGKYLYVCNERDIIFDVQVSAASAAADIGKNASLKTGTGSTTSGLSGMTLDSSTIATTNTLQFHILACSLAPQGNTLGSNYAVYSVVPNIHALAFSTAGV